MIYYLQRMPSIFGIYGDYDLEIINQIVNEIKRKDKEIAELKSDKEQLQVNAIMNTTELEKGLLSLQQYKIICLEEEIEKLKAKIGSK